jgi:hypothetical protein
MTLTNLTEFPPGGYQYKEPSIGWIAPKELTMIGLLDVARALAVARAQNPTSGLDPSLPACLEAVKDYTCARLRNNPKYCGPPREARETDHSRAIKGPKPCASCGR